MSSRIPAPIQDLLKRAQKAAKEGHESQRTLMEKVDAVRTYTYAGSEKKDFPELKFGFHKLELPDALRIMAKLPERVQSDPGQEAHDVELSLSEYSEYMEACCEALALASDDGITAEQFGRMTPPEFPSDLLGDAFHFVMVQSQMTKKQIEDLEFFRGKP